jgi:RimJ/RimL family protein N-acetyltransferase
MNDQCENSAIKNQAAAKPIEGSSIRLWPISVKDAHAIAAIMTPDVSRWLASWPANPTIEAVTERLIRAENGMQQKRELHFRIEERERNQTVGYVSVAQSAADCRVGHLSYWLGSAFQGRGYMTEAVRHTMTAGFLYLNLERIEAGAQQENLSSFAVMRRVGMSPIGERLVWADIRQQNERCIFYSVDRSRFQAMLPSAQDL